MRGWLALAFLALLVAGCIGDTEDTVWSLDCEMGRRSEGEWGQGCTVRASYTDGSKIETWISVNPTDPDNVIVGAKDMDPSLSLDCVWTSYAVTHDAGRSWTPVVIPGPYAERLPPDPTFGYACNTDPLTVFAPDGMLYAVLDLYGLGASPVSAVAVTARMQLYASDDGGLTWPRTTTLIAGESGAVAPDYPRAVVSPITGTLHASFFDFNAGNRCYLTASDDGANSARVPVVLATLGQRGCFFLAASPSGTLTVGGLSSGDVPGAPGGQTWFARSLDDGLTWSQPEPGFALTPIAGFEENAFPANSNVELAYDHSGGPRSGRLYAVYGDAGGGDADVLARWSDDDGASWSDAVPINAADDHDQWMPNVVVADDGSVHAAYLDKGYDAANTLLDLTHAMSLDGGATWVTQRVTSVSFDGDLGRHQNSNDLTGPAPSIGDYLGIDAAGDVVWMAYPDSHLGGPPVMAAARVVRVPG